MTGVTLDQIGVLLLEAAKRMSKEDRERFSNFELLLQKLRIPVGELK